MDHRGEPESRSAAGRVAAIGEAQLVRGYALAGVAVTVAADGPAVRAAWRALAPDIVVVVLTQAAARALAGVAAAPGRMVAVLPEPPGARP
ncbi:hypothetical protein ACFFX1_52520 [Dactylosporangium sucinum]|uniref:Uncharacterized protein n=1 Tax=Dactylosporangium sucinum TaxID=1424081 RepID=A0A917X559_9ACTN|nr:hypothetical protein [Dactylosporangium sucinum]GGM77357.1 hypothetical protein GCM10007977_093580 [Dactylosporangium sucinum]GGM77821.1 hypothetical protein GCM10007977_094110 [Dactylosporangium sucinum]